MVSYRIGDSQCTPSTPYVPDTLHIDCDRESHSVCVCVRCAELIDRWSVLSYYYAALDSIPAVHISKRLKEDVIRLWTALYAILSTLTPLPTPHTLTAAVSSSSSSSSSSATSTVTPLPAYNPSLPSAIVIAMRK